MPLNKKYPTLFALILALCILLSSCSFIVINSGSGEDSDTSPVVTEAPAETYETSDDTGALESTAEKTELLTPESAADMAKKRLEALTKYDFGGQNFIIATTSTMTFAVDGEEYYDRALLLRDSLIEKRYNVDIINIFADEGRIATDLLNASLADDYYADLVSVPEYRIGKLASDGLIMNLRSLPFYGTVNSYSREWSEGAAGNAIYADIGAASADFSKIYAVFFNRDIAENLGYDLDELVSEGKWTWEVFDRISKEATASLDVVGQGSAAMGNEYTDVVFHSGGARLIENKLGYTPKISFDSNELESLIELTCSLVYGNEAAYKGKGEKDFFNLFGVGKLFLAIAPLEKMSEFAVCNVSWGVIPIPKISEEQKEYYGYTAANANVIAVPAENNKIEMTGILIGALNTASYELLTEEYKTSCLYNYFRDSKALRSMDAVLGSMTFDFTFLYSSWADLLAGATYGAVREARTSPDFSATELISSRRDEANAQLSDIFGGKTDEPNIPTPPAEIETPDETEEPEDTVVPTDTESPEDTFIPEDTESIDETVETEPYDTEN